MTLVCFCHLRWNFVYQRPQHLLKRFASRDTVYVIEEPVFDEGEPRLETTITPENVILLIPHLKQGTSEDQIIAQQKVLLEKYFSAQKLAKYIAWYYTPMALPIGEALPSPTLTVYDCMDELSAFRFAPPAMKENEAALLQKADLIFTGGYSLYEAKKGLHPDVYPFPSSIDREHFARARMIVSQPADQSKIPHPRIGFFGVIDERFDINLIADLAAARPEWHFVIVGPVVKIDPTSLPQLSNIYYLGSRQYNELPAYLGGWDVALIPFAANESTQFISPTKTPEYLAGGIPVVSTPIRDVIKPYGELGLVAIGSTPEEFGKGIEYSLGLKSDTSWRHKVDRFLEANSWDLTWQKMNDLIANKLDKIQSSQIRRNEQCLTIS